MSLVHASYSCSVPLHQPVAGVASAQTSACGLTHLSDVQLMDLVLTA